MRRPLVLSVAHWLYARIRNDEASFYRADPTGYERVVGQFDGRHAVARTYASIVRDRFPGGAELIVDLACGTGLICEQLSGVADRVIGLDLNEGMLSHARSKALPNVEFRTGDFHDLSSIDDASADVVTQFAASRYITDPVRHHSEMARILTPGGVVITSYFEAPGRRAEMLAAAVEGGLTVAGRRPIPKSFTSPFESLFGYKDKSIWILQTK